MSTKEMESSKNLNKDCDLDEELDHIDADSQPFVEKTPAVKTWKSDFVYILSIVGFVVDLGNFWRFPTICYSNGGGAFLIPYIFFIVIIGIPLVYLELSLGQFFKSANLRVWDHVCPWIKGIGYTVIIINLCIQAYYNTIIAWALHFALASLQSVLPWASIDNLSNATNYTYFSNQVLHSHLSKGIHDLGDIQVNLLPLLILVFIAVFASIYKGAASIGKAVYMLKYVLLIVLLFRGIAMPGAIDGLRYLFRPDFRKLMSFQIWNSAATQVFFSLGPGFGVLIAYASYSSDDGKMNRQNPKMYAVVVSVTNAATSFLCALVVYSGLGYLAKTKNISIDSFAEHGQSLVFVVYPELIATMKAAPIFSFGFFVMVFLLGLDSVYAGIEGMHAAIAGNFAIARKHQYLSRLTIISVCFLLSIPSITAGGKYVIDFLDTFGVSPSIMFVVFLEVVAVAYYYGTERFRGNMARAFGSNAAPGRLYAISWKYIVPFIVFTLFVSSFIFLELPNDMFGPPTITRKAVIIGYILNCCTLIPIPIYAIVKFIRSRMSRLSVCAEPIETV